MFYWGILAMAVVIFILLVALVLHHLEHKELKRVIKEVREEIFDFQEKLEEEKRMRQLGDNNK